MAEIKIQASKWRLVEVGRVVSFNSGKYVNRLAVIVEIIDHKRVRGPSTETLSSSSIPSIKKYPKPNECAN